MSTAEVTAYLAGVEIGRRADREHVPPERVPVGFSVDPPNDLYRAWQRLGTESFRKWLYRGVWEAWKR